MLTINIDRDLDGAVYAQVAQQIRRHIASGALAPGTAIPSVRQLSRDLGVSLNTVARAYRLLETEGFLVIRDRAGVTVAAPAGQPDDSALGSLLGELRPILAKLRQAGMATEELSHVVHLEIQALERGSGGGQE
jgi:DNA-binding transcriptional regulator YhcF (GntR family)